MIMIMHTGTFIKWLKSERQHKYACEWEMYVGGREGDDAGDA